MLKAKSVRKTESTDYRKHTEKIAQEGVKFCLNSLVLSQEFTLYVNQKKRLKDIFSSYKLNLIDSHSF